jgi:hypothetical protein
MRIIKNIRKKEAKIWQEKKRPVMKKFGEGDFLGNDFWTVVLL